MLKVFLASLLLMTLAGLVFGIKRLFDKDAPLPQSSCQSSKATGTGCGCGGGTCSASE